jgi:hypothetical protein
VKAKDAVGLAQEFRNFCETPMRRHLTLWTYAAEMERGNQNVYMSEKTGQVIRLQYGAHIPEKDKYFAEDYMPTLPHLVTISEGIRSRGMANPLAPEVRPKTSEDADRDAAKAATLLLQSYDQTLDGIGLREEAIKWLRPTGNAFAKGWWDPAAGRELGTDPMTGKPIIEGDLMTKIVPPQAMLIPPGISSMKDQLPGIGEQYAMAVDEIEKKWGVRVSSETGLQDLRELQAQDQNLNQGIGELQDHARVVELFFPPSPKHPKPEQQQYGRHIVVAGDRVVQDDVWDAVLYQKYRVWHPYIKCGYIEIAGDFWSKSTIHYLLPLQVEINRLLRMMAGGKQNVRGAFIYPEDFVDGKKLNLTGHGAGIPPIPVKPGAPFNPFFANAPPDNMDLVGKIQFLIQQMDDLAAYYEVSRGNADPKVTSGKQADLLQQASAEHASPLLHALACFFENIWQLQLRLLSVHLTAEKKISVLGADNETISAAITPDQLRSDDVVVANRAAFFMTPEARKRQIQEFHMQGFFGNPADPVVQQKVARLLELPTNEMFAELTKDIDRARRENRALAKGQLNEPNQALVQQMQAEYDAALMQYQQQVAQGAQIEQALPGAPLPPPPPPPEEPQPWIQPRPYDNHAIHIQEHESWFKTQEFETLCMQIPMLYQVALWHVEQHKKRMPPMPPGGPSPMAPPVGGGKGGPG